MWINWNPCALLFRNVKWCICIMENTSVPQNIKNRTTMWFRDVTSRYTLQKLKPRPWRHLHRPIFSSITHESQSGKQQVSMNEWRDKKMLCVHSMEYYSSLKKEGNSDICCMDEPWFYCAKWNKPNRYDFTCEKPRIVQFIDTESRRGECSPVEEGVKVELLFSG